MFLSTVTEATCLCVCVCGVCACSQRTRVCVRAHRGHVSVCVCSHRGHVSVCVWGGGGGVGVLTEDTCLCVGGRGCVCRGWVWVCLEGTNICVYVSVCVLTEDKHMQENIKRTL